MELGRESREYNCLSSAYCPDIEGVSLEITRKITLKLDVPRFRAAVSPSKAPESSLSRVVSAHAEFKVDIQPDTHPGDPFYDTCIAEVNTIGIFFPDIKSDFLRIAFTAWLAFVCVMDDILEIMPLQDREASLLECINIVKNALEQLPPHLISITALCQHRRIEAMTRVLYNHCIQYLSQASARAFFRAVCAVLEGHVDEIRFLQGRIPNNFPAYMAIRSRAIALNPFFEVIKTEFLAEAEWQFNTAWERLQLEVCRVAGLQNDLIGLVRDLDDGEQLNAVIVQMRLYGGIDISKPNPALLSWCISKVSAEHNQWVTRCLYSASQLYLAAEDSRLHRSVMGTEAVVRHIFQLCETHLDWCASAKRYRVETCMAQRYNTHSDFPSPPTNGESQTRIVKGAACAGKSERNISRTELNPEGSVLHSSH